MVGTSGGHQRTETLIYFGGDCYQFEMMNGRDRQYLFLVTSTVCDTTCQDMIPSFHGPQDLIDAFGMSLTYPV